MSGNLFQDGQRDAHEAFALRGGQVIIGFLIRQVALHEGIIAIGQDSCRAAASVAQLSLQAVFSNYFLYGHGFQWFGAFRFRMPWSEQNTHFVHWR